MTGHARAAAARLLRAAATAAIALLPAAAVACVVCAPGAPETASQRLIDADRAVLAVHAPGPPPGWSVVAAIKGGAGGERLPTTLPVEGVPAGRPVLWVRDGLSRAWTPVGAIDASHADWLRSLARLAPSRAMTDADWPARVAAFAPLLGHAEPMVADTAYGEIARAPYAAMRASRASFDAAMLRAWIDDPARVARRPLPLLLLGLVGDRDDAARIGRRLDAWHDGAPPPGELAALIAADLELRGPARLAHVERAWLLDPTRSPAEVGAAIAALSVHGGDGTRVPRDAVVAAFLRFVERRRALAGLVAQDLAGWGAWDATPAYAALVDAPDVPFWSRVAMLQYLRESPRPEAREALERAMRPR